MRAAIIVRKALSELIQFAVVLIGITFLTFSIMFLSPKNPAELWLAGSEGNVGVISEEAIREQEKLMGLDKPFMEQYTTWLGKAAHGDLGVSFTTKRPVTEELIRNMGICIDHNRGDLTSDRHFVRSISRPFIGQHNAHIFLFRNIDAIIFTVTDIPVVFLYKAENVSGACAGRLSRTDTPERSIGDSMLCKNDTADQRHSVGTA